jgi:hypothetical protein
MTGASQLSRFPQPVEELIMNKSLNVVLAALVASSTSLAFAQASPPSPRTKAEDFAIQNRTLQKESTSMPAGSPAVDKNAKPADPMPKATTKAQKEALFKAEDRQLQKESTPMPAGSPHVNKNAKAADPMPKPTTKAQRAADNKAEEQFLQQKSTK